MTQLTIVIPTMHRPTLSKAIASVVYQHERAEMIVVSDLHHSGAGPTRNRGIQAVRTPWVGFLDDDDVLLPDYVPVMQQHMDDADLIVSRIVKNLDYSLPLIPEAHITDASQLKRGMVGISYCVRTELAKSNPFVNEFAYGEGEDWEFINRLREQGYRINIIPDVLYDYRHK